MPAEASHGSGKLYGTARRADHGSDSETRRGISTGKRDKPDGDATATTHRHDELRRGRRLLSYAESISETGGLRTRYASGGIGVFDCILVGQGCPHGDKTKGRNFSPRFHH
jgi:hypothetical protein